jgi:hypothetical protein
VTKKVRTSISEACAFMSDLVDADPVGRRCADGVARPGIDQEQPWALREEPPAQVTLQLPPAHWTKQLPLQVTLQVPEVQ